MDISNLEQIVANLQRQYDETRAGIEDLKNQIAAGKKPLEMQIANLEWQCRCNELEIQNRKREIAEFTDLLQQSNETNKGLTDEKNKMEREIDEVDVCNFVLVMSLLFVCSTRTKSRA